MKRKVLILIFFAAMGVLKSNAQIVNFSFENWALDTFRLPADTLGTLPADTVVFNNPLGWTSSNFLTGLDSLGHLSFVSQSANAYIGASAVQMVTDSVNVPAGLLPIPVAKLIIPGFVVSGQFSISASLFTSSTEIAPGNISGAGQPCTAQLDSIHGYYNYTPVYNAGTSSNDTCIVWATLRKGSTIVANAIFKSTESTGTYKAFSAPFQYISCEVPDTLVMLLASSTPNIYTFLGGTGGLVAGSSLLVDDLYADTLPNGFSFPPFAKNDVSNCLENGTDTVNVLANDTDCGEGITVTIQTPPLYGTATLLGNEIVYTPNQNYLGEDTMYYKDSNTSGGSAIAQVIFIMSRGAAIQNVAEIPVEIYPVPTSNVLNIQFQNDGKSTAIIYDLVGNQIQREPLNNYNNRINVENLANGLYGLQIIGSNGSVISHGKFVVAK